RFVSVAATGHGIIPGTNYRIRPPSLANRVIAPRPTACTCNLPSCDAATVPVSVARGAQEQAGFTRHHVSTPAAVWTLKGCRLWRPGVEGCEHRRQRIARHGG